MVPRPTPLLRLIHIDNLEILLARQALHAPNHTPNDGLRYRTIHRADVQGSRNRRLVPCGPRGDLHDYVPFCFGSRSVMLLQLKTGRVAGYSEGQRPLVHLVVHAQDLVSQHLPFVFTDGHALAGYSTFYESLDRLDAVDWNTVNLQYWNDTVADPDRQRRKQAEFLVHERVPWALVRELAVVDHEAAEAVRRVLANWPLPLHKPIAVRPEWYYP